MVTLDEIVHDDALAYLVRQRDRHLMHLGALLYDQVRTMIGLRQHGVLIALVLIVDYSGALPNPRPTMMVAADDPAALLRLVQLGAERRSWPDRGVWAVATPALRDVLESWLQLRHSPLRGLNFYGTEYADGTAIMLMPPLYDSTNLIVRSLSDADATTLDLSPCNLSITALRSWLRQGWRAFGVLQQNVLLAHVLAAYPIGDSDEIAAVYTAARARRRGIGAAVVAAVITDSRSRGRRAFYVAQRTNLASCALAERLGLAMIAQTWEIVIEQ
ncbi:MAG: GNAT family N-acetyltransferase [Roseiflexaceae bacterium]|nr:GNAT family N-acetyltransferase [Roseiflexaceae bacterium]